MEGPCQVGAGYYPRELLEETGERQDKQECFLIPGSDFCFYGFRIELGRSPASVDSGSSWESSPASLPEFELSIYSLKLCSTAPVCVAVHTASAM